MDNSLLRRRLGRRAFLTGAGGMAAAAATLALGACGEGGDSESGGTAPGAAANPQSAAQPQDKCTRPSQGPSIFSSARSTANFRRAT